MLVVGFWGLCMISCRSRHLHTSRWSRIFKDHEANTNRHDNGGFGAAPGHDPHMLYTVSAVQILCLVDGVDELDRRREGGRELVGKCKWSPYYDSALLCFAFSFHFSQLQFSARAWIGVVGSDCNETDKTYVLG